MNAVISAHSCKQSTELRGVERHRI